MATYTVTTSPMLITSAATVVSSRPFLAKFIEWIGPTAIGNTCTAADLNSNFLFGGVAGATLTSVQLWNGPAKLTLPGKATQSASWQVSLIQSGTLAVYF